MTLFDFLQNFKIIAGTNAEGDVVGSAENEDYKVVIIAGAGNVKYVFIPSEVVYDHEAKIVVIRTIYGKPELIQ